MKTTIEEINGELMTVVWHTDQIGFSKDFGFGDGDEYVLEDYTLENGSIAYFYSDMGMHHIATALPALLRNPKPEDAEEMEALTCLFSEYRAKGLMPQASINTIGGDGGFFMRINPFRMLNETCDAETTHGINTKTGERVEIAIKDTPR